MTTRVTITADAAHSATLKILADGESCDTHVFDGRTITIKEVD